MKRQRPTSSRAGLAALALSAAAIPALAQDFPETLIGEGEIVVCTWGGGYTDTMHDAWFGDFTDGSGVDITTTSVPDLSKLQVMAQVGNIEWDLIDFEGTQMLLAIQDDLLEPIDYDLIHSIVPEEELIPAMKHEYGIGSVAFSTVIAWNTDLWGEDGPQTWAEFFDGERFDGRRALYAQPRPTLEIMLMADGIAPEDIYPIDIDRAFEALDKFGPMVDLWVDRTSQWDMLIQNAEVDLMGSSLSRTSAQITAGYPVDLTFGQSIVEQSYWVVPKGAPGAENAQKLIAWMMRKEGMAEFLEARPAYSVANRGVYDLVPAALLEDLPGAEANSANALYIDDSWWLANTAEVQPRWLEWLSRQ